MANDAKLVDDVVLCACDKNKLEDLEKVEGSTDKERKKNIKIQN